MPRPSVLDTANPADPARRILPAWLRRSWPLILILVVAAALRLYGLNWDSGHWLHPDERKVYFVVMGLGWPHTLAEALSVDSPLNPGFFAYGSLPIYLLKSVASLLSLIWPAAGYLDNLHLVGRPLVALFDVITVYLTYRLGFKLWPDIEEKKRRALALLAAALTGAAVLHVQLAHFYTADPLLAFFVMLTLNLAADVARGGSRCCQVGLGVALGLALATKVSAFLLILVVPVAYDIRGSGPRARALGARLGRMILPSLGTLALAGAIFFFTQPYALIDWRTFLEHTLRESEIARGLLDVPYTIQYAGTLPFFYTIWQTALWGLGLPLGLLAWAGLAASFIRWLRQASWADALLLAWAGPYFVLTGLLYARHLRYVLPLAPVLCILAVRLYADLACRDSHPRDWPSAWRRTACFAGASILGIATLVYALVFVRVYAEPHSWVTASEWIFDEIPAASTLAVEHWDMALPLPVEVDGRPQRAGQYYVRPLHLYDEPDDPAKWQDLAADLADSDYLIVASRRLYGSIPRVPDRYPVATRYYELLFAGDLGFELAGEFTRGPTWLNPRLPPLPDPAPVALRPDESFVVYDHPRALIFVNAGRLSSETLLHRLSATE